MILRFMECSDPPSLDVHLRSDDLPANIVVLERRTHRLPEGIASLRVAPASTKRQVGLISPEQVYVIAAGVGTSVIGAFIYDWIKNYAATLHRTEQEVEVRINGAVVRVSADVINRVIIDIHEKARETRRDRKKAEK